jgi:ATP-dependent helicase HrpB
MRAAEPPPVPPASPPGERLPIDPVLPALVAALARSGRAVLQAPPGAGKTTRVPLALLGAGLGGGRILLLEPRRIAARAAAERLAAALGEAPGGRVGFRIRGESRPGSAIEVVTEGILTRMIQADPELAGIGTVIFDEFHERALQADLGLALALEVRGALRPDLRLLAMSATLDAAPVAALMGDAPIVTAGGRAFAVETIHATRPTAAGAPLGPAVAELALRALAETEGGVLVFLPGAAEIRRTAALLRPRLPPEVALQPLYGALPVAAQRAALAPLADGRKLVLATAIAETSLTIPDVRVVVDGGRARRARFDPGSGMTRLVTTRVTRAEADQRRGRAGRTAPGWCYRLWTRGEEGALSPFPPPEIASVDLAPLALELALWGAGDAAALPFLTPPPEAALAEGRALLRALGALDAAGRVTAHGRILARLPVHPRLGHMLVAGGRRGDTTAPALAALLEARDPLLEPRPPADLALRLAALRGEAGAPAADRAALAAIRVEARRLARLPAGARPMGEGPAPSPGALLSLAYPDRIARRRAGDQPRYLLSGGSGARLADDDPLATAPFLVAADLDGDPREAAIRRALPVAESDLRALHGDRLERRRVVEWSPRDRAVAVRERLMLGAIALEDRPWRDAPPEVVAAALAEGVRSLGIDALPWTPAARRLQARLEWLRGRGAAVPPSSDSALLESLEPWLAPFLVGMRRLEEVARVDLAAALSARLDHEAARTLAREAPATLTAPTGTRLPIDYASGQPAVSVRLQELFGMTVHPSVGPERTPLLLHLLSPAGRPVQSTSDLPGFWKASYAEVRRALRGRYPRHPWPEDPASAEPTRRAAPRRNK